MKKTLFLSAILGAVFAAPAMADWNDEKTVYTYDAAAATDGVTLSDIAAETTQTYTVKISARQAEFALDSELNNATIAAITDGTNDAQSILLNVSGQAGSSTLNLTASNRNDNCLSNITIAKAAGAETAALTLGTINGSGEGGACHTSLTIENGVSVTATTLDNSWGLPALTVNGALTLTELKLHANNRGANGYTYSGTGTITTQNLSVYNYGGSYNFSVANLVTSGEISLTAGTTTTFNGTNLSIANKISNSATLKFTGNTTIDITTAVTNGTISLDTTEHFSREAEGDGWAQATTAYTLVTGNAAIVNDGVVLTVKNGEQTLSSDTNTFDGKRIFTGDKVDTQVWYVKTGDASTTALNSGDSASATGLFIASGKTLTMDSTKWNLANVYGEGNVVISTNSTIDDSKVSAATGSLTVRNAQLNIGGGDGQTSSLSSFSSVILDGGTLRYQNKQDTLHNVTVETGKTGTINSFDMGHKDDGATLTFADTTTVNGTLNVYNQWNAQFNMAKVTGSGTINLKGTDGGDSSSEPTYYTIRAFEQFKGALNINQAQAEVTLNGSFTNSTGTITLGKGKLIIDTRADLGTITVNNGGTLTLKSNNTKNGRVAHGIVVNAGGTLACTNAQDAFGYDTGTATESVTLGGTATGIAKMTTTHRQTILGTNITLNGNTIIEAAASNLGTDGNAPMLDYHSGTITVTGTNNTIAVPVKLQGDMTIASSGSAAAALAITGAVTGGRTITMANNLTLTIGGTLGTNFQDGKLSAAADGLTLTGTLTNVGLGTGDITFDGARGYLSTGTQTYAANITLNGNGFTSNNGNSGDQRTFTGSISGNGNFVRSGAGTTQNFVFSGDVSDWSGSFKATNDNGFTTNVTFNGNASTVGVAIGKENTNVLNLTAGADSAQTFSGDITVNKMTISAGKEVTATGALSTGTLVLEAGSSLALQEADKEISSVTLGGNSVLTLGDIDSHAAKLTTSSLSVVGDAKLNADLKVSTGGTMDFSNHTVLTLGCSVEIGDSVIVKFDETELYAIQNGQSLVIIDGVDKDPTLTLGTHWDFRGSNGQDLNGYGLFLRSEVGENGTWKVVVAPEPATATLSLLALAGLAARRKRR